MEVAFVKVVEVNVAFGQYGSVAGPEKNCAFRGTVSNSPQKYTRKSPPARFESSVSYGG
jgi:hypothetical protein